MIKFFENDKDAKVRIHGNGFLQAELPDGNKMHVWADDCPKQDEPTLIHNHTSGFTSDILYGVLQNTEYVLGDYSKAGKDDVIYNELEAIVRHDKDTVLQFTSFQYFLSSCRIFTFTEGSHYDFPGNEGLFHATNPITPIVVTRVIRWDNEEDRNPMILIEEGKEPDNSFDRYGHQEYAENLYEYVKNELNV